MSNGSGKVCMLLCQVLSFCAALLQNQRVVKVAGAAWTQNFTKNSSRADLAHLDMHTSYCVARHSFSAGNTFLNRL